MGKSEKKFYWASQQANVHRVGNAEEKLSGNRAWDSVWVEEKPGPLLYTSFLVLVCWKYKDILYQRPDKKI